MPRLLFARSDKRCRCCGLIVIHQGSSYDLEHYYFDYDSDGRRRIYCSKRCLMKGGEDDDKHL